MLWRCSFCFSSKLDTRHSVGVGKPTFLSDCTWRYIVMTDIETCEATSIISFFFFFWHFCECSLSQITATKPHWIVSRYCERSEITQKVRATACCSTHLNWMYVVLFDVQIFISNTFEPNVIVQTNNTQLQRSTFFILDSTFLPNLR